MKHQDSVFESEDNFVSQIDRIKTGEGVDNLRETDWKQTAKSLVNYETWKRRRMQKKSLQQIAKVNNSPIIQIANACGIKNGQNEMLNEFVEGYDISKLVHPQKLNEFQRLLKNYDPLKNLIKMQGKLIDGKKKSRKKLQINKLENILQEKYKKVDRRIQTQTLSRGEGRSSPVKLFQNGAVFKQIKELNKLALLPAVCRKRRTKSSSNPQISQSSNSPVKLNQQNLFSKNINTMYLTKENKKGNLFFQSVEKQQSSKKSYIQQIKNIVNRSDELLNGQSSYQKQQKLDVTYTQLTEIKFQTTIQQMSPRKTKKYEHWPSYERYSIQSDNLKTKSLNYGHLVDFTKSLHDIPKELNEMIGKVQLQFQQQQEHIDREIIQNEKNSLDL